MSNSGPWRTFGLQDSYIWAKQQKELLLELVRIYYTAHVLLTLQIPCAILNYLLSSIRLCLFYIQDATKVLDQTKLSLVVSGGRFCSVNINVGLRLRTNSKCWPHLVQFWKVNHISAATGKPLLLKSCDLNPAARRGSSSWAAEALDHGLPVQCLHLLSVFDRLPKSIVRAHRQTLHFYCFTR